MILSLRSFAMSRNLLKSSLNILKTISTVLALSVIVSFVQPPTAHAETLSNSEDELLSWIDTLPLNIVEDSRSHDDLGDHNLPSMELKRKNRLGVGTFR